MHYPPGEGRKVAHLLDPLGFDAAIDYRQGHVAEQLRAVAPDRFSVYFDNVGGEHLEAALSTIKPFGRVVLCGAMSALTDTGATGPRNLAIAIGKRLTLRGFLIGDHQARHEAFLEDMARWLTGAEVSSEETIVVGVERAPEALAGMLQGKNLGKMLVSVPT